jgi:hypothetical protein
MSRHIGQYKGCDHKNNGDYRRQFVQECRGTGAAEQRFTAGTTQYGTDFRSLSGLQQNNQNQENADKYMYNYNKRKHKIFLWISIQQFLDRLFQSHH